MGAPSSSISTRWPRPRSWGCTSGRDDVAPAQAGAHNCQSAPRFDPRSASNFDPLSRACGLGADSQRGYGVVGRWRRITGIANSPATLRSWMPRDRSAKLRRGPTDAHSDQVDASRRMAG
jgi:hypothetical protein